MSTGMETVDSGEVAPEAPQPTCIRVHVHQESALAKLLLSSCSLLQPLVPAPGPASRPLSSHRLLVASWAVLAGAVAFIYEKRGGIYWALLRTLLALGAFSTAMAAIITGASGFHEYSFYFYDSICDTSPSWGPTRPPGSPNPDVGRLRLCISYLDMLKAMVRSLQGLLLGVWVLLLLASLVPLCLYCWKRRRPKEKRDLPLEETVGGQ
ncbi:transmembrane protein 176A isoform X2 [Vicugna pacos]|uniref:Transmembrane protein 176A isoform X2 n=1 Tax=Vicugna pacos TaxID=30538 RepID=A0ABM5DHC1_VICPA